MYRCSHTGADPTFGPHPHSLRFTFLRFRAQANARTVESDLTSILRLVDDSYQRMNAKVISLWLTAGPCSNGLCRRVSAVELKSSKELQSIDSCLSTAPEQSINRTGLIFLVPLWLTTHSAVRPSLRTDTVLPVPPSTLTKLWDQSRSWLRIMPIHRNVQGRIVESLKNTLGLRVVKLRISAVTAYLCGATP